ncbi:hypothetical protein MRX96_049323 [Rhipicephalus microplus]
MPPFPISQRRVTALRPSQRRWSATLRSLRNIANADAMLGTVDFSRDNRRITPEIIPDLRALLPRSALAPRPKAFHGADLHLVSLLDVKLCFRVPCAVLNAPLYEYFSVLKAGR